MKLEEMKNMNINQLKDVIFNGKQDLLKMKIEASRNKRASKPHLFPKTRRQIARAYTLMREKMGRGE